MDASHLLVWFEDGQPRACQLPSVPDCLVYKGETFRCEPGYFGDVDYLRDKKKNTLVGFAYYSVGKWKDNVRQKLLSQSKNVRTDGGSLVILLEQGPYETESVAAMGTEVYSSPTEEVMFAIPNWGFGKLGFRLATEDTPWPEYLKEH